MSYILGDAFGALIEITIKQTKPVTTHTIHKQEHKPVLRNSRLIGTFSNNQNRILCKYDYKFWKKSNTAFFILHHATLFACDVMTHTRVDRIHVREKREERGRFSSDCQSTRKRLDIYIYIYIYIKLFYTNQKLAFGWCKTVLVFKNSRWY
jgi:hypothetical protein